jgi:hypothetical protein
MRVLITVSALLVLGLGLSGCAVAEVGGAVIGAGASVVGTAVSVTGDVVSAGVGAVTGSGDSDDDKKKKD